ncbi:ferredoxin-type protein NapF [Sansalvadorimonas sp. 2012CJ34-2]|uniref:Ferredoxin-type protein NapF n=1 Tax=Parendozoicomonas callyspongiae TaxID=2942213 RepID=A0ABT0PC92_9GAMM|nr:ferredoxin-type protein NapF [Sansalvadorimonas sp. 2012CJ34-2]MCL6268913.1 ferredoxin-type protein NapF [Sansalvadorimonas sp. 2012CJ34-2]
MQQAVNQSRRNLFRGRINRVGGIRPPWSLPENKFLDTCVRCNDCIDACETNLLKKGDGGYPIADFSQAECTFCEACVKSCSPKALLKTDSQQKPWNITATINDRCLAKNKVHCRTCGEQCEVEAITFRLAPGGVALPNLDTDLCNGCGACVSSCPVSAVAMKLSTEQP